MRRVFSTFAAIAFACLLLTAGQGQVKVALTVPIEAEDWTRSTFSGTVFPGIRSEVLSGGAALQHGAAESGTAAWEFVALGAGRYDVWVREYARNYASTIEWRIDEGPWQRAPQGVGLPESLPVTPGPGQTLSWSLFGRASIAMGMHVLEMRTEPRRGRSRHVAVLDKIVLTTGRFDPRAETVGILAANEALPGDGTDPGVPEGWFAWPLEFDTFAPSILDEVAVLEKPTGTHGRVTARGGRFVFEDGTPARFWGCSGPATPDKADADYFARRARRLGINMVRLHTLDGELIDPTQPVTGAGAVDPALLDKMDYFIARLGQEGIYVLVDCLYDWVNGPLKPGDGIPEWDEFSPRNRNPWFYDPRLQLHNAEMVRLLLDRVNPYTGRKNGDDPTVAMLTVVNENGLFFYSADRLPPYVSEMRRRMWNEWLRARYGTDDALRAAWGRMPEGESLAEGNVSLMNVWHLANPGGVGRRPENRARTRDQVEFMSEVQNGFYRRVRAFVRDELGFRILVNGSGWHGVGWLDQIDEYANANGMDFISRHGYWDHSRHGWGHNALFHHRQMLASLPTDSLVQQSASRRPAGVPFTMTEWNQVGPNDYLPEAVPVMACYGALQDWGMLLQYRMDFPDWPLWEAGAYRSESPAMLYQYPVAAFAFLHGYVSPGDVVWRNAVADRLDPARIGGNEASYDPQPGHTSGYLSAGAYALIGRCENAYGLSRPVSVGISDFLDPVTGAIRSVTGELEWKGEPSPSLRVTAPKLKGFAGLSDGSPVDLGGIVLRLPAGTRASVFLASVDGLDLAQSRRMLLTVVGPVSLKGRGEPVPAEETGPGGEQLYRAERPGRLPIIMKEVSGRLELDAPIVSAVALSMSGRPAGEIQADGGGRVLSVENRRAIWYELRRESGAPPSDEL
jgi:hypothetical protein